MDSISLIYCLEAKINAFEIYWPHLGFFYFLVGCRVFPKVLVRRREGRKERGKAMWGAEGRDLGGTGGEGMEEWSSW